MTHLLLESIQTSKLTVLYHRVSHAWQKDNEGFEKGPAIESNTPIIKSEIMWTCTLSMKLKVNNDILSKVTLGFAFTLNFIVNLPHILFWKTKPLLQNKTCESGDSAAAAAVAADMNSIGILLSKLHGFMQLALCGQSSHREDLDFISDANYSVSSVGR